MADLQKQSTAWAKFQGFKTHLPSSWDEKAVSDYHQILADFESAYGVDLAAFKIAADEMQPKLVGVSRIGISGSRRPPQYTDKRYCNEQVALRKLESVSLFLQDLKG